LCEFTAENAEDAEKIGFTTEDTEEHGGGTEVCEEDSAPTVCADRKIQGRHLLQRMGHPAPGGHRGLPVISDFPPAGKTGRSVFIYRFGGWRRVPEAMQAYAREQKIEQKWPDVMALIARRRYEGLASRAVIRPAKLKRLVKRKAKPLTTEDTKEHGGEIGKTGKTGKTRSLATLGISPAGSNARKTAQSHH